jgi:hypothetical protein
VTFAAEIELRVLQRCANAVARPRTSVSASPTMVTPGNPPARWTDVTCGAVTPVSAAVDDGDG